MLNRYIYQRFRHKTVYICVCVLAFLFYILFFQILLYLFLSMMITKFQNYLHNNSHPPFNQFFR